MTFRSQGLGLFVSDSMSLNYAAAGMALFFESGRQCAQKVLHTPSLSERRRFANGELGSA